MGFFALLIAGLAGWLVWTGRLQRMTAKDGMALGIALVGAVLSAKGKPMLGAPLLLGATIFFLARTGRRVRRAEASRRAPPPAIASEEIVRASALLGLSPGADADAVRAAHRRLIASVHPDRGGTEALAAQINAARDLLLQAQGGPRDA